MNTSKLRLLFTLPLALAACRWETDLPDDAKAIHVDQTRELFVTDEHVISGELASNRANGPLSFRHAMSSLPLPDDATLAWLDAWSRRLGEEARSEHDRLCDLRERVPCDSQGERAHTFDTKVTCPWLRATPENGCDVTCSACTSRHLALENAPFRLTAVVNRTDLSVMPDRAADGGEGRLVFALTDGPADDPASPALPFALILEYAQQGTARAWTERWHALGSAPDFPGALTALTETFVASGSLAQIRTADAFTGPMVFHQFRIEDRAVVPVNVRNSPDWQKVAPESLRSYASVNAQAIKDGVAVLPEEWWASYSSPEVTAPTWLSEVPQRDALVRGTCAGCHAQSATGFHVNPLATGEKKASSFLVDGTKERDELRRRVEWMQLMLTRD